MRRAVEWVRAGAVALLGGILLAGCAPLLPGDPDGPFVGDWRLVQAGWGESQFTVAGTGITLVSDGEAATGFAGCHDYGFRLTGNTDDFTFGERLDTAAEPTAANLASCIGSLERVESRYLSVLLAADDAELLDDDVLVLSARNSYLVFESIPPFPGPRLAGTEWVLLGFGEQWRDRWASEVIGAPTLRFVGRDRILGTLGCGSFLATYRVVRTQVQVSAVHSFGAHGCRSPFSEQDGLLAQFMDGFRAQLIGTDRLLLTHDRFQLLYGAAGMEAGG